MTESFNRFPEPLDPDEPIGKTYTFPFSLAAGDSLTGAVVEAVDSTSSRIITTTVVISQVAFGLIGGNLWGVTFHAQGGGSASIGRLYLRCRFQTSLGNGDDRTCFLLIQQR